MGFLLRKCVSCGRYTLRQDACPYCGGEVRIPHPPKFSIEDRLGEWRRKRKKELMELKST
ncbi:MAG: RNA-protein complex protein Nop10 [Candidatus Freyarchaeota archaeon]|nr:RNA-protein complex protein Nop10 [Candidatus Freyrarchaeum guaymaensis]HDO80873.1 RNA-protein complex protein Nop10 [Candidatus Bathyarchaeota archaeon]